MTEESTTLHSIEVPEGYVLVPVDPTKEMRTAGWMVDRKGGEIWDIYKAMISAAQEEHR